RASVSGGVNLPIGQVWHVDLLLTHRGAYFMSASASGAASICRSVNGGMAASRWVLVYPLSFPRQHFLYFLPLPQGQGSLRPTLRAARGGGGSGARAGAPRALKVSRASRSASR